MRRRLTYLKQRVVPYLRRYGLPATAAAAAVAAVICFLSGAVTPGYLFCGAAAGIAAGIGIRHFVRRLRRRQELSVEWLSHYLRKRGFYPETDRDGDLLVRIEGMKYVLHLDERYFELHIGFGLNRS